MSSIVRLLALSSLAIGSAAASTVAINDHFDDGSVTGWQSVGNGLGATHNITESGTNLTSQVIATQGNLNTHRGIASTTSFNPAAEAGGFSMTFVVSSQGALAPGANGMFLGVATSNSVFFRDVSVDSFGLTLFGHATRTQSNGGASLVTNDQGSGGSAGAGLILGANPLSIQLASLQDGFTANVTADPTGWSFSITDINNTGGSPTTLADNGTWAAAGTDFASVFPGTDWYALGSNQGDPSNNTHTTVFDQINVTTIPEPSAALFGLLGLGLLGRRRRA